MQSRALSVDIVGAITYKMTILTPLSSRTKKNDGALLSLFAESLISVVMANLVVVDGGMLGYGKSMYN